VSPLVLFHDLENLYFSSKNLKKKNLKKTSRYNDAILYKNIITLPPDEILKSRKSATLRHCEKGRSPDEAIQRLATLLRCRALYRGLAMTLKENVGW